MATPRRRNLLRSRRRIADEGEEEGSIITDLVDDSASETSVRSDVDLDADADDSDLSDPDVRAPGRPGQVDERANGSPKAAGSRRRSGKDASGAKVKNTSGFATTKDTDAMMNGLSVPQPSVEDEGVEFGATGDEGSSKVPVTQESTGQVASNRQETLAERRRREHEEYKKKRDSDPAFIPNRGAFFMHDHRTAAPGQNGFRPFGRGRGRGAVIGGPYSPANLHRQTSEPTSAPWTHDLHETVIAPANKPIQAQGQPAIPPSAPSNPSQPPHNPSAPPPATAPIRSFSKTTLVGNIQIRVSLSGMKNPITFSAVPVKRYTKLPNHRPPLRRDKPVRISLPDRPPSYIFPAVERSFIFIPRALRPNQQGFGRGRGRGGFGSIGGGFSSRRTSVYGGSIYSPSVAMSRRSSLARDFTREGLISPSGSVYSQPPRGPMDAGRPVVRLPPGSQQHTPSYPLSGAGTPITGMPPQQPYPLPQKPTFRENWNQQIPMHQPRPQKAVSVAGIESPASLTFHAPQPQEQQPFSNQLPQNLNGQPQQQQPTDPSTFYPHQRQLSYPSQPSVGTPLSNIPERAIHAQPFQPVQQPPPSYPQHPAFVPQPAYYYPAPNGSAPPGQYQTGAPGTVIAPMFVQNGQQPAYIVPTMAPAMPQQVQQPMQQPAPQGGAQPAPQGSMVAHEQNGMVYYYDPNQMYVPQEGYAQPGYTMPGMGGMMTPTPDGYYYPGMVGQVFYQPQ